MHYMMKFLFSLRGIMLFFSHFLCVIEESIIFNTHKRICLNGLEYDNFNRRAHWLENFINHPNLSHCWFLFSTQHSEVCSLYRFCSKVVLIERSFTSERF